MSFVYCLLNRLYMLSLTFVIVTINICSDLMAKRKEENFCSPENAKRPRQEELEDFDKDGDEDECTISFTNGTSTLVSIEFQNNVFQLICFS